LRINIDLLPPNPFVAAPMQVAMMGTTERHREFITYFAAKGASLGVLEMVRIRGTAAAGKTRLRADEPEVIPVP
jgi:hypothetical protein